MRKRKFTRYHFNSNNSGVRSLNGSLTVGILAAGVVILGGLISVKQPLNFINLEGLLIVFGGTIASTLIQFSLADLKGAINALKAAVVSVPSSARDRVNLLMELSHRVKQQGILVLEEDCHLYTSPSPRD